MNDVVAESICTIFANAGARGRGPIEAHVLYRLWESRGLRRDDLAYGIRALVEAGLLRAELHAGNCDYFLTKPREHHDPRRERMARSAPAATEFDLTQAANQPKSAAPDRAPWWQSSDRSQKTNGSERRTPQQSRFLAALPKVERDHLFENLELVPTPLGQVLWEQGDRLLYVYFPIDCVISLLNVMQDGSSNEIAVVGNEGMIGVSVFMGGETAPSRALVQEAGYAYRLAADILLEEFRRAGAVQRLLLRYAQALMAQIAQIAACNRHHTLQQQLCRELLSHADRLRSRKMTITHESIANMLGVRRPGVTEAIGALKKQGLICTERGMITLLDRAGLEKISCDCYAVMKQEFDRLRPSALRLSPTIPELPARINGR